MHVEDASSSSSSSALHQQNVHRSLASRLEQDELRQDLDDLIDEESKAIQEALQQQIDKEIDDALQKQIDEALDRELNQALEAYNKEVQQQIDEALDKELNQALEAYNKEVEELLLEERLSSDFERLTAMYNENAKLQDNLKG